MTAHQLLLEIEGRGATIKVAPAIGGDKLQIAPKGLVGDLASDIQKFKPALLELLSPDVAAATASDDEARRRVMPELRAMAPDADILAIGRALLKLDAGEEIE